MAINLSPKGVKKFKIYFGKDKLFYTVYIFKTREQMVGWCKEIYGAFNNTDFDEHFGALTHPWSVQDKYGNWTKDIGFLAFCEPYLWNYVIAHEMAHATIEWFLRDNKPKSLTDRSGEPQEAFAWHLGEGVRQVMKKLEREK